MQKFVCAKNILHVFKNEIFSSENTDKCVPTVKKLIKFCNVTKKISHPYLALLSCRIIGFT